MDVVFRHDPLRPFRRRTTPHALYVRRVILGDDQAARRVEECRLRTDIYLGQRDDGSWNNSVVATIDRLFLLYMLGDHASTQMRKAVDWLLENGSEPYRHTCGDGARYDGLFFRMSDRDRKQLQKRRGLITSPGCSGLTKTSAALFFAAHCGLGEDPRVQRALQTLVKVAEQRGLWCSVQCSSNILRAFFAHSGYGDTRVVHKAVDLIEKMQEPDGDWRGASFFYHMFNVMAHSRSPNAVRQIERAIPRLIRSQNANGTWGRMHSDLLSLLVLDGLHRQGLLKV